MNLTAEGLIEGHLNLPTLPNIVAKINALVDDPEVGTREIGRAVSEDAPMAAQVLRIANSALFGLREKVLSTEHATAVLGVRRLRNLAMQASVIRQFRHLRDEPGLELEAHWRLSILTGQMCAVLAKSCRARIGLAPDEFQVVGLLLDIGQILLLDGLGETYAEVIERARTEGRPLHEVEQQVLGYDHAQVGALIATRWGLPAAVSNAIRYHHGTDEEVAREPVTNLVAHVSRLSTAVAEGRLEAARAGFRPQTLRQLGLRESDVEGLVEAAVRAHAAIRV